MSRMKLYEGDIIAYTFVNKKDGKQVTEDVFLSALKSAEVNKDIYKRILDHFDVYENGKQITMDDYFERRKLRPRTDTAPAPTEETDLGDTPPSGGDKSEPATTSDIASADKTSTDTKTTTPEAPADVTPATAKITDATVTQLVKLIDDIGVTVYDKNTHKKVALNKIDGRSLNDYVILLGGKNPVSVRAWLKRLRERGVLTESMFEDFTADEMTQSGQIYLYMNINSELEDAEFTLDIDEVGQLTITPEDESVSFDGVSVLTKDGNGAFVSVDNDQAILEPTLTIDYTMTSSDEDFTYFATIDDIGQIIITPENDNTSFVSATVGDNLNISAEDETMSLMESLDSVLKKVREETEDYTTINGEITVATEEDADIAKTALEMYYDIVSVGAKEGLFVVAYADEEPTIVETLTEDAEEEENLPAWKVSYKFAEDIEQDGEVTSATVNAETSEDANKFGEQYARKMALEDDSWKNAKIVSLQLLK